MQFKRSFNEYFERSVTLSIRYMRVRTKYAIFRQFNPVKALFIIKRYKRIIKMILAAVKENNKKGYDL